MAWLGRISGTLGSVLSYPVRLLLACMDAVGGGRKLQERRQSLRERPPLDNDDYLASLDISAADRSIAVAVRDVVASACGVASTALRPDDRLDELEPLPELLGPPIDWSDLLEQLADWAEIDIPIQRFADPTWGRIGRDEFAADLKQLVRAIIALSPTQRTDRQSE